ncbi:MAG: CoA ester lyase [Alphaproteobacteria bacterium]|nr:CoA ester lyase [Alphaproteobacteria bacterium]
MRQPGERVGAPPAVKPIDRGGWRGYFVRTKWEPLLVYRSLLFVPGSRPDRFEKAAHSGADAVCIDLEDAVAPDAKDDARAATFKYLARPREGAATGFRMNPMSTMVGHRDLVAFVDSGAMPAFLMVPKASGEDEIALLDDALAEAFGDDRPPLWPLVETPSALPRVAGVAKVVGARGGIMLGGADFAATIGAMMDWDGLYMARASIVAGASQGGCQSMDVPYLNVKDDEGLRAETLRVRSMGFTGRACIHPAQVAIINEIFSPSEEDVSKAERIAAAYAEAGGGVALLDGKLVERPVLLAAQRTLAAKRG